MKPIRKTAELEGIMNHTAQQSGFPRMLSNDSSIREDADTLKPKNRPAWHLPAADEVLELLKTDLEAGLSDDEAKRRLDRIGPNDLVERGLKSPRQILWEQATSVMVLVLVGAGLIKAGIAITEAKPREWIDAGAIFAIVILNVVLGFFQEYRAEKAMAALKKLSAPLVRVRRGGHVIDLASRHLVPGDIVLLEAGNSIPADLRVVQSVNLRAQEASMTGESLPVDKNASALSGENIPLGDRRNMLYMGTSITYGRGAAVVAETGMRTELGRIAELIQSVETGKTPLQKRIVHLGLFLALAILAVVALMVLLGAIRGEPLLEMFLAGVAIAVAAIPEGLPAVMTITLALGAQRMLKRRALIRRLHAVETLGSVTTICSDKTGTLTENKMRVTVLEVAGHNIDLTERMRGGHPVLEAGDRPAYLVWPEVRLLLAAGSLCNDAHMQKDESHAGKHATVGDPTEGAILVAAAHYGLWKERLERVLPRVAEAPFTSERKRMTTVHQSNRSALPGGYGEGLASFLQENGFVAFTKGSADGMLPLCASVLEEGEITPITPEHHRRIEAAINTMAKQGLRVLAVAARRLDRLPEHNNVEHLENELVFIGLIGMIDPPRPEVKSAVETCLEAGIRPVMITGDHPLTALEIARQLQIARDGAESVLTGRDLAAMTAEQLEANVEKVSVYARVSPEHKLNIVEALQRRGHVVAMTGDGVNDAPALRRSQIGVAMGITGTDVSKEAADMVITDDNFATIVSAVEEGRTIYDNVRKFVKYIVTSNSAEVTVMFLTQMFAMPLPMTTLQILWMNLVTDGVPGLALGLEPTEKDAMKRKPFAPGESIFSRGIGRHIVVMAAILATVAFGIGFWAWSKDNPAWGTMVFVTLTLSQLGHALAVRSNRESLFKTGLRSNPILLAAVVVTLLLQMAVVYLPPFQTLFGTLPLTFEELAVCLGLSTIVFWAVEIEKWLMRRAERKKESE